MLVNVIVFTERLLPAVFPAMAGVSTTPARELNTHDVTVLTVNETVLAEKAVDSR